MTKEAGRPTKYEGSLCDEAFQFLSSRKCRGVTALAAEFGLDEKTIYRWRKQHPEFKKAVDKGLAASKALLMKEASDFLVSSRDSNYNTPLFSRLMQAVYRDSETATVVIDGFADAKTTEEQLNLIINKLADGEITPEQADKFTSIIMKKAQLLDMVELKQRLEKLEAQNQ